MRIKSFALAAGFTAASLLGGAGIAGAEAQPQYELHVTNDVLDVGTQRNWDVCGTISANGVARGTGCFDSNGDWFLANDQAKDGLGVRVDWNTDYGRNGDCWDRGGAGGGGKLCNENLSEKGKVRIQIELWDGNKRVAQSGWSKYVPV